MNETREKTFECSKEGMIECQKYLASICESPRSQIIMDEIVSNIVRCSGAHEFTVRFDNRDPDDVVAMTFIDAGKPFDPTKEIAEPDVTAGVEERGIGGLGMFMVRKMAKSVSYRRENDRNVLSVQL